MTKEQKIADLHGYLKLYSKARPTKAEKEWWAKEFKAPTSLYAVSRFNKLRNYGAMFLVAWGRQSHRTVQTQELVDLWVNRSEEQAGMTFHGFPERLLIVHHLASTPKNSALPNLINYVVANRALQGKPTLIISECDIPEVKYYYQQQGWPVLMDAELFNRISERRVINEI